jgi:DNA-directed RNA polymerase alpha subunit
VTKAWRACGLSTRAANALEAAAISSEDELRSLTEADLLRLPEIGLVTLLEILDRFPPAAPHALLSREELRRRVRMKQQWQQRQKGP